MRQISYALTLITMNVLFNAWTVAAAPGSNVKHTHSSQLASVSVTSDRPQADSTHFFTMTLPAQAGQRFTQLSFSFTEQNQAKTVAPLRFNLASTKAFTGAANAGGRAIAIKDTWIDETGVLWVEFNAPVPPKTQLTLALQTLQTSPAATYGFGIAAYPETKDAAVFVGDGSLTIRQ